MMEDPRKIALKIIDVIELRPQRWDQNRWVSTAGGRQFAGDVAASLDESWRQEHPWHPSCGTTACVAGWAVILAAPPGARLYSEFMVAPDEGSISIWEAGAAALGLAGSHEDRLKAHWLFKEHRTRAEVLAALAAIAAGADWDPPAIEAACDTGDS